MKNIFLFGLVAVLLAGCGGAKLPAVDPQTLGMPVVSEIGDKFGDAVSFTWMTPEGTKESFAKGGKTTIVAFWKYSCASCLEEAETVNAVYEEYKFPILVVCINTPDTLNSVVSVLSGIGMKAPVVFDPGSDLARAYGVSTIPDIMLINGEGKILKRKKAGITVDHLLEMIEFAEKEGSK